MLVKHIIVLVNSVFVICSDSAQLRYLLQASKTPGKPVWHGAANSGSRSGFGYTCGALKNAGSHSTVQIQVGTPLAGTQVQVFDVVADTGSGNTIIPSCICVEKKICSSADRCFTGTNRSSTFSIPNPIQKLRITFGSGPVDALVASDVVKLGKTQAMLNQSLLLMVSNQLDISGSFEGVLGLFVSPPASSAQDVRELMNSMPQSFLDAAQVQSFSICFNPPDGSGNPQDGALRLNPPIPSDVASMGSIGLFHWGLDFRGISVGNATAQVSFCRPSDKKDGQTTSCGIIPDSGTTVIMGLKAHIDALFDDLCDKWARCKKRFINETAIAQGKMDILKHETFQHLLMECEDWMVDDDLSEVPPIYFHVAGSEGVEQIIELDAHEYIQYTPAQEVATVIKYLYGLIPIRATFPTGRVKKVCLPSFGPVEYITQNNGPVWIFGTALFYKYQVLYNLRSSPPAISLVNKPCGSCKASEALLSTGSSPKQAKKPRLTKGLPRVRRLDPSIPL